jgi:hypothetical protein
MLVLSAVEFGSAAYGSARKTQLKKLDSSHNKRLRIALGAFCINRTQNLLIEAEESTLQQRREIKTANMALKITTKLEHPINRYLKNKKAYDKYELRPSLTTLSSEPKKPAPLKSTSKTMTRRSNWNTRHGSQT